MNMKEAMWERHTIRKFELMDLPEQLTEELNARVQMNNEKLGTNIQLVVGDKEALPKVMRLFFRTARNYYALVGPATGSGEEALGYASADIMLHAKTLGADTWWIGGTYSKKHVLSKINIGEDERLIGIVVVGLSTEVAEMHKSKDADEISCYVGGDAPDWFEAGVAAVLAAPTAMNRQNFKITGEGNQVVMRYKKGALSRADLGIGKYHFELGAGKENFEFR